MRERYQTSPTSVYTRARHASHAMLLYHLVESVPLSPPRSHAHTPLESSHRHLTPLVPVLKVEKRAVISRDDTAEAGEVAHGRPWGRDFGRRDRNNVLVDHRLLPRRAF